jgi:4-hydroxybenzoyl-CoA reductase subunit beta
VSKDIASTEPRVYFHEIGPHGKRIDRWKTACTPGRRFEFRRHKERDMRLPAFEYLEPRDLKAAADILALDAKGTVLLAGGTDLIVNMKHRVVQPQKIINLKIIPRLAYILEGRDGLRLGSLTTLHDLISSPLIQGKYSVLGHAAKEVGAYAHQAMGTIGGNLCQGNRCRYYNQSVFWRGVRPLCYKTGGKTCHIVRRQGECHATYCGDMAPVLIAMDARMRVLGPGGERVVPLQKLYTQNGNKPLSLKKGEILREVVVPPPSGKTLHLKWRLRNSIEFPIVSLAVHIDRNGSEQVKKARIIFSGVGPGPVEALATEKMLKESSLNGQEIEGISNQVFRDISPMRTSVISPAYKRKMAGILLGQALEQMRESIAEGNCG